MSALRHILVATDFGTSSQRAVGVAAELAARLGARLTVLYVIRDAPPVFPVEPPLTVPLDATEERERTAKHELDSVLTSLAQRAPACEGVVRFGEPAPEIVDYAERTACDMIIVGTHGRGRLARWLLGSVAEKVVRSSRVPVLTVRGSEDAREEATPGG